jgi:hypothetical protein
MGIHPRHRRAARAGTGSSCHAFAAVLTCASFALCFAPACGGDAQFHVQHAPELARGAQSVSVLGVYKDGRLAPEAWETLGAALSSAFAGSACPIGFDEAFLVKDPALSSAIDDYSRADGVTDDLLERLAPAAQADTILVFTVAGRPPSRSSVDGGAGAQMRPTQMGQAGMGGRGARPGRNPLGMPVGRVIGFEVAATLYSVSAHKSVATVAMEYTGDSTDAALAAFAQRLRGEMPGSTCRGWSWEGHVDVEKIRTLEP